MTKRCLMIITGALTLGGGIAAANRLALHALLDAGYLVNVIALNEPTNASATIPNLDTYRGMANRKIAFAVASWRAILTKRYQVIFCDHVNLAMVLAPLSWTKRCKYIVRLNGVEVFPGNLNWEGKTGLKAAHRYMAISDHTKEMVLAQIPNISVKVCDLSLDENRSVLPNIESLSISYKIPLLAVDGCQRFLRDKVILHVGRMSRNEQYKGQDMLIHAFPHILASAPGTQLVLVGRGDDEDRLLQLARRQTASVQEAIFMTGFVSDEQLEQLYQSCYIFAMPSRGEGFGLVYLEAMRWAKPCLGSRTDSARCIIHDGETGLLVDDPTCPEEIGIKLADILNKPEKAKQMGASARQLLESNYLYAHFSERFLQFIQSN